MAGCYTFVAMGNMRIKHKLYAFGLWRLGHKEVTHSDTENKSNKKALGQAQDVLHTVPHFIALYAFA